MRRMRALLLISAIAGCGRLGGPASTDTSSDSLPTLDARIEFLQRYVRFRRNYRDLGFHIHYLNGGASRMPRPSEWDIRIVAVVPPEELAAWIPPGAKAAKSADLDWLKEVPGGDRALAITEWYDSPHSLVGIDREKSIVAYRASRF